MPPKNHERSQKIHQAAQHLLPGGVDSPVRAFKAVGGQPVVMAYGKGSRITDVDGNEYVDYVGSWGPLILGHAHPSVVQIVQKAAERGTSWLGTLVFGLVHQITGSYRPAIFALIVFFAVGMLLLARVDVRRGIAEAGNAQPVVV